MDANKIIDDLRKLVKSEVFSEKVIRVIYSTDASIYRRLPLCVIRVRSPEDVVTVIKYCAEEGIPLAPRGGGTGLAGESLTRGILLDFSVYFKNIDQVKGNEVWVDSGVVPEVLNHEIRSNGLLFGPDPATADRCTIGGMIGINSTGSHSLVYGYTSNKVQALDVVLGNGERTILEKIPLSTIEDKIKTGNRNVTQDLLSHLKIIADKVAGEKLPFDKDLKRNRNGYRIWGSLDNDFFDPTQFVLGSEGTLAVVLRAKLALDAIPVAKGLLVLKFTDRTTPLQIVPEILEFKPAAIEFMDNVLLNLARTFPVYRSLFSDKENSWLLISFEGSTEEVREKLSLVKKAFSGRSSISGMEISEDPKRQAFLSGVRTAAVPLLYRRSDGFLPLPFLEDCAVPPARLFEYVKMLEKTFNKYGLEFTAYGHAGPGELHVRPFIKPSEQIKLLPEIAKEVFEKVMDFGGTVSGEHGDGLLRSFFIRRQYGDGLWNLFKEVKKAFDPEGILNPGKKIVEDDELPLNGLRYISGKKTFGIEVPGKELDFPRGELARGAFACTGCGTCRSVKEFNRMCPVFRVLKTEEASPRSKTNLLREIASGGLSIEDGINKVLDLCLWCRSCGRECPSGLSVPELIIELRGQKKRSTGLSIEKQVVSSLSKVVKIGSFFPRIYNFFLRRKFTRNLGRIFAGIDPGMPVPELAKKRLAEDGVTESVAVPKGKTPVAYFADIYSDFFDPELGRKIISVLEKAGCFVVIPKQEPCGIIPLVYGKIDESRKIAERNTARLLPFVEAGFTVISSEPTAALMLRKDYKLLLGCDSPVFENVFELGKFLYKRWKNGEYFPELTGKPKSFAYHKPCHLFELDDDGPGFYELFREALGLDLRSLPESCCGLGGTFGMRSKYSDIAGKVGAGIFSALKEGGFDGFLTECASCRMQIEAHTKIHGYHPCEFL